MGCQRFQRGEDMLQGWQTDTTQKIRGVWKEGRRGLMGAALLLAAGTAGYVVWQSRLVPSTPEVPAQVTPQIRTVTTLGRLEPAGEVIEVSAPAAGERSNRIDKLLVAEAIAWSRVRSLRCWTVRLA
ncbi:MAG: hypothetical protein HC890_06455 [Chloroflexaceae bacterium]|nr:hypothetical protein [Chloroflexaceae bacterium]